jgi:hypothetical protein
MAPRHLPGGRAGHYQDFERPMYWLSGSGDHQLADFRAMNIRLVRVRKLSVNKNRPMKGPIIIAAASIKLVI